MSARKAEDDGAKRCITPIAKELDAHFAASANALEVRAPAARIALRARSARRSSHEERAKTHKR
eukprot:930839-Prymnesium_polylepis.1